MANLRDWVPNLYSPMANLRMGVVKTGSRRAGWYQGFPWYSGLFVMWRPCSNALQRASFSTPVRRLWLGLRGLLPGLRRFSRRLRRLRCRLRRFSRRLRRLADRPRRQRPDILRTIKLGYSNARLKDSNNRIKVTIRMAYGFHHVTNLISLVMLRCGGLDIRLLQPHQLTHENNRSLINMGLLGSTSMGARSNKHRGSPAVVPRAGHLAPHHPPTPPFPWCGNTISP